MIAEHENRPQIVQAQTLGKRVLRRAWTEGRLTGSLRYPHAVKLRRRVARRKER